jgi:uncharacterized protein
MPRNLLAEETSPYLLQHKTNPVHWRPWGEPALGEAKRLDRPILLSVGYAACHWCHVMAHESFEDETTAALMNELFVTIKVDREERPDIDSIYQSALGMLGQQGGWPLTMFLTPDGEPFWGGTYFPPTPRYGRPGFPDVLRQIAHVYHRSKDTITKNVSALRDGFTKIATLDPGHGLSAELIDEGAAMALRLVDPIRGGTAGAPKFPQPTFFRLLWRAYRRTRASMFRDAVLLTLDALCKGGLYDHLAGGFARYSTDAEWLVPHFEKMLYDNALLIELLTEVWLDTGSPLYARRIEETIDWLFSEMCVAHPTDERLCAFAAAVDADSEGVEGKYYVWSDAQIDRLLGADAAHFKRTYDVTPLGNWEDQSILNLSGATDIDGILQDQTLQACRATLKSERDTRVPPGRDDKVLADWNGLMITALVRAATAFTRPHWLHAARSAFAFVTTEMSEQGRLRHAWCSGAARHPATIDDYANMARAALSLHEATLDPLYLETARDLAATAERHYWDAAQGGYFFSADDTTDVITRSKSIHDNPVPSGNSTMVDVLARLSLITGDSAYRERADALVQLLSGNNPQYLTTVPGLLMSAELLDRAIQIVIIGPNDTVKTQALHAAALRSAPPLAVVLVFPPNAISLAPTHPAFGKTLVDDQPAAYVCVAQTCSPPIVDADALRHTLSAL